VNSSIEPEVIMSNEKAPKRLGRGLEALLSSNVAQETHQAPPEEKGILQVPLGQIRVNPFQPRKTFTEQELQDLQNSLKTHGLVQPITVRRAGSGQGFELISGERRLRAAQRLGWNEIPALVRDADDQASLTVALIENLQRADLNPVEEAEGYTRLSKEFKLDQQQIAEIVGKDRSTVANALRLLVLPFEILEHLRAGLMTAGHARPLIGAPQEHALAVARDVIDQQLSVREVERRLREDFLTAPKASELKPKRGRPRKGGQATTAQVKAIENLLRRRLQTDVSIALQTADKGEIRIRFYSADDMDRLLQIMGANELST
jgi:ParB family transcriptional regulator, chromosome partitioning protein